VVACGCGISRSTNHAPSDAQIEKTESFFKPRHHDEKSKIPDERLMTYFCLKRNVFSAIDRST
jgi:hypothetical protein